MLLLKDEFIECCERFSNELSLLKSAEKLLGDEIESMDDDEANYEIDSLRQQRRELFKIRNEIDRLWKPLVSGLSALSIDTKPIESVVIAAWGSVGRFQDAWFECHAYLRSLHIEAVGDCKLQLNEEASRLLAAMMKFPIEKRVSAKQLFESDESVFRRDTTDESIATRLKRLKPLLPQDQYGFTVHESGSYGFTWRKKPKS